MVEFILYVADQERSKAFYERALGSKPVLHVPGMTEFLLNDQCKLGLMPESGIAKILGGKTPHPASGSGVPRCELYLYDDKPDAFCARLLEAGATEIAPLSDMDWGDRVGYYSDPDGHVIAIARKIAASG